MDLLGVRKQIQKGNPMSSFKKVIAPVVAGALVSFLLYLLTPRDMRPLAVIAVVVSWSVVLVWWRPANARQRFIFVVFATLVTLMSLLAFLR
jgi:hypothetical protein